MALSIANRAYVIETRAYETLIAGRSVGRRPRNFSRV